MKKHILQFIKFKLTKKILATCFSILASISRISMTTLNVSTYRIWEKCIIRN